MNQRLMTSGLLFAVLSICTMVFTIGCESGEKMLSVTGSVTFNDAPVTEGDVTFENPSTGFANTGAITADGTYSVEIPAGEYQVTILPPTIVIPDTPNSPGGEEYKKVDNIPGKYHNTSTSGLKVSVSKDSKTHDFNMEK